MLQFATSSAIASNPSLLAPAGRRCAGVPAFGGARIVCDVEIPSDRRLCGPCDGEIERRNAVADQKRQSDGRTKLLQATGISRPFVLGVKSLQTVRPVTNAHRDAIAAAAALARWTVDHGCTLNFRIVGDPGVGKSDLAEGAIAAAATAGHSALFVNARSLNVRLQASYRDDSPESTQAIIDRYATTRFLGFDDLGASKPTRFTADALYEIFERRTRDRLPTIVTSNYITLSDLATRLAPSDGDALDSIRPVDRLDELCPRAIVIRGSSLRSVVGREGVEV
jgi:DNA replication protein DnaC